ncbi:uncharacterized protein [Mytilus edulis]|uniref:uncharacterized protein n=1 Tax=Mytilus edulis TaxID=6550 RepID=UPI0039F00EDF
MACNLPTNHIVKSMLDKRAIQMSAQLCNSCQINNEAITAISWCTICEEAFCEQCDKCHKSFKFTAKHKVISIQEIQSGNSNLKISEVLKCEEYSSKNNEVYCVDHSQPCCTLCAQLSHRKFENVTSIENPAKGIKQFNLTTTLIKNLDERNKELDEIIAKRKDSMNIFENTSENIIQEVSTLKMVVIDHLNKLEEKIKFDLASSKIHVVMKFTDEINTFSSYKSVSANWKSVLNVSIEQGSDQQCLMEVNRIGSKMTILEKEMDETIIAISTYRSNTNLFVDISEMKLIRKLDFSDLPVYGLCYADGNLFIISDGSTLTWVSSKGEIIKQKSTRGNSFYVSTSDMKDCIYGDGDNSVSCVVGNRTKFTYTSEQLSSPRGIGIDFEGNIYIAGWSSKNIHQITDDGNLIRTIPIDTFGIRRPWTIRFAPNSNKLVVTCSSSGKVVLCEIS